MNFRPSLELWKSCSILSREITKEVKNRNGNLPTMVKVRKTGEFILQPKLMNKILWKTLTKVKIHQTRKFLRKLVKNRRSMKKVNFRENIQKDSFFLPEKTLAKTLYKIATFSYKKFRVKIFPGYFHGNFNENFWGQFLANFLYTF